MLTQFFCCRCACCSAPAAAPAFGRLQGAIDAVRLEPEVPGGAAGDGLNIGAGGTLLRKIVSLFPMRREKWSSVVCKVLVQRGFLEPPPCVLVCVLYARSLASLLCGLFVGVKALPHRGWGFISSSWDWPSPGVALV